MQNVPTLMLKHLILTYIKSWAVFFFLYISFPAYSFFFIPVIVYRPWLKLAINFRAHSKSVQLADHRLLTEFLFFYLSA